MGCGAITERGLLPHLALTRDAVEVTALCDLSEGRMRRLARSSGIPQTYIDYNAFLRDADIDAVAIATPIPLHYKQARRALASGRHVYLQKTMTGSRAEALRLIGLSRSSRLILASSPGQMLLSGFAQARDWITSGQIGEVYAAVAVNMADGHENNASADPAWYYQAGGGPLRDMGVYSLHAITGILGPVRRVSAFAARRLKERHWKGRRIPVKNDDNVVLALELASGSLATLATTYSANPEWMRWGHLAISGSKGTVEIRHSLKGGSQYECLLVTDGGRKRKRRVFGTGLPSRHDRLQEAHVGRDLLDFVGAIRKSRRTSHPSAAHACHVISVLEAAEKSARSSKVVSVVGSPREAAAWMEKK